MSPHQRESAHHWATAFWLVAIVAGVPLRLTGLLADVPTLDEYHPLYAVSREKLPRLLSTFGLADRSIPIALYFESLTHLGGLDPIGLRLPFVVGGIGALAALPLAFRRWIGDRGAAILAALMAVSPLLVYYSRAVRPYGLAAFALLLAIAVHDRWLRSGAVPWLASFGLLSGLAVWALPVFAPFAAGSTIATFFRGLRCRDATLTRRAALGGLVALIAGALLLAPAVRSDFDAISSRTSVVDFSGLAATSALRVLGGSYLMSPAIFVLAVAGFAAWKLRFEWWANSLTVAAGLQLTAVAAVLPLGVDEGRILARYMLPAWLAILVLFAALGRALRGPANQTARIGVHATAIAVLAAALAGPLRGWLRPGPDNFASDRLYERLEFDRPERRLADASPNYRRLAGLGAGSGPVLEVPFFVYVPRSVPELQSVHRQAVFLGVTREFCSRKRRTMELPENGRDGFELPWFVHVGDLEAIRAAGIRFVVFHRDAETRVRGLAERHYFYDFARCVDAFRELSGATPVDDGNVAMFDLAVRPAHARTVSSAPDAEDPEADAAAGISFPGR